MPVGKRTSITLGITDRDKPNSLRGAIIELLPHYPSNPRSSGAPTPPDL